jgi:hypothetical protein
VSSIVIGFKHVGKRLEPDGYLLSDLSAFGIGTILLLAFR